MVGKTIDLFDPLPLPIVRSDVVPIGRGTKTFHTAPPFNPLCRISPVAPVSSDFPTWVNQGTATITDEDGSVRLVESAGAFTNLRCRLRSLPAGTTWTVTLGMIRGTVVYNYFNMGLILRESATSKLISLGFHYNNSNATLSAVRWTDPTTFSANIGDGIFDYPVSLFLRAQRNGTALTFTVSFDGVNYVALNNSMVTGLTDFFTTAPDQWGLFVNPVRSGGTGPTVVAMDAFHWSETNP